MGRKKDRPREVNLLELVPKRLIGHEVRDGGLIALRAPRFKSRLLRRLVEPRLRRPFLRVELDDIGSAVWELCDGERNIGAIARTLEERFGERIQPCHERLGLFFGQLERARFICFVNLYECRARAERENTSEQQPR